MEGMLTWAVAGLTALFLAASGPTPAVELEYLQHSGWLIKTPGHVLLFDYVESLSPTRQLPSDLRLGADSFDERQIVVFVSHSHADHFFPGLREWAARRPSILFVVGWPDSGLPNAKVMKPREVWSSDGLRVAATASTDEGVGFLVSVDGLTVFHGGDLARWVEAVDKPFMGEIAWLKEQKQPIDIAFFAVATGGPCEPRPAIWEGVEAAARELSPRVLIPMHVGCPARLDIYERFRTEVGPQLPDTQVVAPSRLGQTFQYDGERVTPE
jgi:L-ascorbate metabolism protein UlaG (beta-lactamase superfamily)